MKKIYDLKNINFLEIGDSLKKGKLIIYPTDTVYGVGGVITSEETIKNIYRAKERSFKSPLIVLVSDIKKIEEIAYIEEKNREAIEKLIAKFWPGGLTIILKKKEWIPSIMTADGDTVGVRMPDLDIALNIIKAAGGLLPTTSANISGEKTPRAYDELSEELKAKVSNYDVLESAEKEYARLLEESEADEADKKAASAVDELINKLEPVTIDKKDAILQARKAYDMLTKKQQSLVVHPEYLNRAEQTYDKLKAQEVSAEISAILTGTITLNSKEAIYKAQQLYDALTDNQKKLVTNYKQLQNAKAMYQNLILASPVIELIKNIGEVTLEKGGAITRAIEAYNALTAEQQELVSNYSVLEEAYQNYSDLLAAHQVSTKISQIGVVTKESGSLLGQIRNAYNNLSDRQKSLVENYSDLEKAESAYQGLNKSDETSQIKNTAAAGETANSHAGAHESGYAKQNGSSNATGSGNAAEKSGDSKNTEQAQEKKTEETAKENQEAKTEQTGNADGEESSAENETALLSGEEGDAGVSMQNGEENTAKSSAPAAQNYRVVKILCAVLGVLVILVLAGIGFMVIGSKKRKKILLKY